MRLLKVDWQELEEAFVDDAAEHRYYLDRETGAVHFFSTYLEDEEEVEDERRLSAEPRYVSIPPELRRVPASDIDAFCRELPLRDGKALRAALGARIEKARLDEVLGRLPRARERWDRFHAERLRERVRRWLRDVGVQPL